MIHLSMVSINGSNGQRKVARLMDRIYEVENVSKRCVERMRHYLPIIVICMNSFQHPIKPTLAMLHLVSRVALPFGEYVIGLYL